MDSFLVIVPSPPSPPNASSSVLQQEQGGPHQKTNRQSHLILAFRPEKLGAKQIFFLHIKFLVWCNPRLMSKLRGQQLPPLQKPGILLLRREGSTRWEKEPSVPMMAALNDESREGFLVEDPQSKDGDERAPSNSFTLFYLFYKTHFYFGP